MTKRIQSEGSKSAIIKDQILQIEINGKIPFLILCPDSVIKDKEDNSQPTNIPPFEITIKENNSKAYLFLKSQSESNNFHSIQEIFGELSFSLYAIVFPLTSSMNSVELFVDNENRVDYDKVVDLAVMHLNKFLEIYSVQTKRYWIDKCHKSRFSPFEIYIKLKGQNGITTIPPVSYEFRVTGTMGVISQDKMNEIQKLCKLEKKLNLTFSFLKKANRYMQIYEFEPFLIYIIIYIEASINNAGVKYLIEQKKFEPENAKSEINKLKYSHRVLKFILGIKYDLLIETSEYKNFKCQVLDRRNDLVHGRAIDINMDIAQEILNISRDYMYKVRSIINSSCNS